MTILGEGEAISCDWFKRVIMNTTNKLSTLRGSEQQIDVENVEDVFKVFATASNRFYDIIHSPRAKVHSIILL